MNTATRPVGTASASPVTPLQDAIATLESAVNQLHSALDAHTARVASVLCPVPATAEAKGPHSVPDAPSRSRVTEDVHKLSEGVMDAAAKVRALTDRLDT